MAPISPFREFLDALLQFPAYFVGWTVGLIVAILTDLHVTTLAVAGVATGVAAESLTIGVAAFFVLYVISRIVANLADAVGHGLNNNARAIINK
jgi:fucose 4-O-acetylase-like acetyltransferase